MNKLKASVLVAVAALVLATLSSPVPAAASHQLWHAKAQADAITDRLVLAPDGSHHILTRHPSFSQAYYATDRGGKWVVHTLFGVGADMVVDAEGNIIILTLDRNDDLDTPLRVYWVTSDSITTERIGGNGFDKRDGNRASLAIDSSGRVHIAWSRSTEPRLYYVSGTPGDWAEVQDLSSFIATGVTDVGLEIADDVPVAIASTTYPFSDPRPDGCSDLVRDCVVAVTIGETSAVTGIGPGIWGLIDTTLDDAGAIHAAVASNEEIHYVTDAGGAWAVEDVATVNPSGATIDISSNGPVILYGIGTNEGLRRADRGGSGWSVTTLTTTADYQASGLLDAQDRMHLAYTHTVRDGAFDIPTAFLIAPDEIPPIIGTPRVAPTKGKQIGASTVPSTISWSASDAQSGPAKYQLQRSTSGGSFGTVSSTLTSKSTTQTLTSGTTYAYRVRGWDKEGLVSSYMTGPTLKIDRYQDTASAIKFSGSWTRAAFADYSRGSVRYSNSSSATATVTFTGRGFAWVSSYGPNRGTADVIVDGISLAEVSTYRTTKSYRRIVYSMSWEESSLHTVQIKPRGTAGHPRIDVDAVLLVR